jgi:hypothetical protein
VVACSSAPAPCASVDDVLAPGAPPLMCAEALTAIRYIEVLAGRPTPRADRNLVYKDLRDAYRRRDTAVRLALEASGQAVTRLSEVSGLEAAEERSRLAWTHLSEGGPLDSFPQASRVLRSRVAVWVSDDDERLVLTEADIEGWISYASLAREVQSGGPLKLSVAQREKLYRSMRTRYREATREEKIALSAVGPFWQRITTRWRSASYDEQQAWAQRAPLPPPMTSSSLGYAEAIFEMPVAPAARALHSAFEPLHLDGL